MKRITALLLAIMAVAALAVCAVGCSSAPQPSPTNSMKGMLDALKAQDVESYAKYYSGTVPETMDLDKLMESDETIASMTDEQKAIIKDIYKKVLDFDYTVDNEKVDGDKATVDVTFKTYDFGGLVDTLMSSLMSDYMSMAMSGGEVDQAAVMDQMLDKVKEAVDGLSEKSFSTTVTMSETKDADGNWKVDDVSQDSEKTKELADALLGGLMSKVESLLGSLSSTLGDALGGSTDAGDASALLEELGADAATEDKAA